MEAYTLVGPFLFGLGIRVLHHEVLDCNLPMRRILHGAGIPVQATLREHAYIAGRWWDVHVYGLDERDWQAFEHRLRRFLPWHGGRFAALAG